MKRKTKKAVIKEWIFSVVSVVLATIYMPFFLYATNSEEVNFSEILFPLGILLLVAVVLLAVGALVTKSPSKTSLMGILFILLLENYHYGENAVQYFIPSAKYWHILPVFVFAALHVCYVICVVLREETRRTISTIASIVIGALIFVNFIGAVPNIVSKINVSVNEKKVVVDSETSVDNDGANIYYFLLDEAAPFNVIEEVYESDMSEYKEFYTENNFMISEGSYNDSYHTKVVLTNLINIDYVADDETSDAGLERLRQDITLKQVLLNNGYELYGVGNTVWLGIDSLTANGQRVSETVDGKDFAQIVMETTFLYPFFEKNYTEEQTVILDTFDYFFEEIYDTSSEFKFTYVRSPHQPFLFDENGNDVNAANYDNWDEEKYYLGQYKFIMKKVRETIAQIIEKDPESIIIVASDHGPRFNPEIDTYSQKVKNVLQMVYFKGQNIDEIDGLSGVNTLRYILSKQLGIELPLVEVYSNE